MEKNLKAGLITVIACTMLGASFYAGTKYAQNRLDEAIQGYVEEADLQRQEMVQDRADAEEQFLQGNDQALKAVEKLDAAVKRFGKKLDVDTLEDLLVQTTEFSNNSARILDKFDATRTKFKDIFTTQGKSSLIIAQLGYVDLSLQLTPIRAPGSKNSVLIYGDGQKGVESGKKVFLEPDESGKTLTERLTEQINGIRIQIKSAVSNTFASILPSDAADKVTSTINDIKTDKITRNNNQLS